MTEHHHEAAEANGHERPTWLVRLALGIGGIILLAFALIAWQMHMDFGGRFAMVLPWIVVVAILLGTAAVIESITSTVWIALIGGIFVVIAAFLIAGRFTVEFDAPAHAVFMVDRFTGEARLCDRQACRNLSDADGSSAVEKVTLSLPQLPKPIAGKK
jgi:hypothetical protein